MILIYIEVWRLWTIPVSINSSAQWPVDGRGDEILIPQYWERKVDQQFTPSGWLGRYLRFIKVNFSCHLKKHIWGKGHFRSLEATGDIQYWAAFQIQNLPEDVSSVDFSHSVVSNSLQPRGVQHARPSCPSPTPGVYSNSCPLSRRCHPTSSSSVIPFSRLQSFLSSGFFQMSQL